jgi:hypothetical protein
MKKHRFSINEWVFNEDTCSFSIGFSVLAQDTEDFANYSMTIPYALEEPVVFCQKVHNSMVLFVNNLRYLDETKQMLSDMSFIDMARPSVKIKNLGEINES